MKKRYKRAILIVILVLLMILIINTLAHPMDVQHLKNYKSPFDSTVFSLLPPIVAIVLALISKEVYSSLFLGIFTGALLYSNFNMELMFNTLFFNKDQGMVAKLANSSNVGILVFLVMLGSMVALMNKAGGSAAFGRWAAKHIKTRMGAELATIALGVMIFIDDYFNCLTVGSVMRPVTDRHNISRAKLAYLIDATAAPVCIIAPISSWAAAVTSSVPSDSNINGFLVFLRTIPYNYYALLTIVMMIYITVRNFDYGPMRKHEENALKGDLFTSYADEYSSDDNEVVNEKGKVIDLVLPVLVLIVGSVAGMLYSGGFFDGVDLVTAFASASASVGLVIGGFIGLAFTFFFYMFRGIISFSDFTGCFPEGFKQMVAPILILTLAWTLSGMTKLLGAATFVGNAVGASANTFQSFLPAIIFAVAVGLSFATGTSWGTFSILIPIVLNVFPGGEMMVISIASCLSGAVCGDHCSPISDTTIMSSAGAQCHHLNHVTTQLPYALTVAAVSLAAYVITGFIKNVFAGLLIAIVMLLIVLRLIEQKTGDLN